MRWTCNGAMFLFTTMMQYPPLNLYAFQLTFQSFTESVLFPLYLVITTAVNTHNKVPNERHTTSHFERNFQ